MRLEVRKYLFDIQQAITLLLQFTAGKAFADFERDAMMRAAVEREFEIVGEALIQIRKVDPPLANRVTDCRRIIAFRNILIHGYAQVDSRLVWDVVETKLPILRREIEALLQDE